VRTFDTTSARPQCVKVQYPPPRCRQDAITLTLMAPTAFPRNVSQAKFVTGWFDQLGLKVTFKAVDEGYLSAANFNFTAPPPAAPGWRTSRGERDRDGSVTEALGDDLRVDVSGERQARVRVPQLMEADARQLGRPDRLVERL
jgi:hypothetical protein